MHTLQFDGASKSNPGRAGSGCVIFNGETVVEERTQSIELATNNQAEYIGLMIGLKAIIELGITQVQIEGDSMLVVKQVKGEWKVKEPTLQRLHAKVMELLSQIPEWSIRHIYREHNKHADRLSNQACQFDHRDPTN
jgi:ribonuclease HI